MLIVTLLNHFQCSTHAQVFPLQLFGEQTAQFMIFTWKPKYYGQYNRIVHVGFSKNRLQNFKLQFQKRPDVLIGAWREFDFLKASGISVDITALLKIIVINTDQVNTWLSRRKCRITAILPQKSRHATTCDAIHFLNSTFSKQSWSINPKCVKPNWEDKAPN